MLKTIFRNDWSLTKLFFKNYFKRFEGPFYGFLLPLFFLVIFVPVFAGSADAAGKDPTVLVTMMALALITNGLQSLSVRIAEWKSSVFIKRIGATAVTKTQFLSTLIGFYFILSLGSAAWIFGLGLAFFSQLRDLSAVDAGMTILGLFMVNLLSVAIGIFIGGIVKSFGGAMAISMAVFFPTIFLTGIVVPGYLLNQVDVLKDISYILPLKFGISVLAAGWAGPDHLAALSEFGFSAYWIPILIGCIWILIMIGLNLFTFKWE